LTGGRGCGRIEDESGFGGPIGITKSLFADILIAPSYAGNRQGSGCPQKAIFTLPSFFEKIAAKHAVNA